MNAGARAEVSEVVDAGRTAKALGSGTLEVYATPAMIALMEKAAWTAVAGELPEGASTVGTMMNVRHLSATPPGAEVFAEAVLTEVSGKKLTFRVSARDGAGPVGEGVHERFIIDNEKFMAKANSKNGN